MIVVGKNYIYFYRSDDSTESDEFDIRDMANKNGTICTVIKNDSEQSPQYSNRGGLYSVLFEDGSEYGVYGEELVPEHLCIKGKQGNYWPKFWPNFNKRDYAARLCYGWEETDCGIFHSFELTPENDDVDSGEMKKILMNSLDAQEDRFDWNHIPVRIPDALVAQIKADAIVEYLAANEASDRKGE